MAERFIRSWEGSIMLAPGYPSESAVPVCIGAEVTGRLPYGAIDTVDGAVMLLLCDELDIETDGARDVG